MKIQVEIIVPKWDFLTGSLSFLPHPVPALSPTASLVQATFEGRSRWACLTLFLCVDATSVTSM